MNIHSIFFKLNLFFAAALIAALVAGFSTVRHFASRDQTDLLIQSRLLIRAYRATRVKPMKLIREFGLVEIPREQWRPVLRIRKAHPQRPITRPHRLGSVRVIPFQGHLYLWIHPRDFKILLRQEQNLWQPMSLPVMIFGAMVLLLAVIYWLLRRALLPIRRLQGDILDYGRGAYPETEIFSEHKDEIAQVGNAFYDAAHHNRRLTQSRQLFVRNIFHELNTPVTKGKILTELVDEPKTKTMLDSIFSRLATLLKELAQMEQITSQDTRLETKPVRIIDLIDQACDLLYLDEPIETNVTDQTMEADFPTMSLAFKNLIDNGRKYGKDIRITHRRGAIDFVSRGAELEHPLLYYIAPFSSGDAHTNKGFGLGLYIVDQIAIKHGISLRYHHHKGENIFTLSRD